MYQYLSSFPFVAALGPFFLPLFILVSVWTLIISGVAMWRAARNNDKWWFIAFLVIHTLGILELVYLIWFAKKVDTAPAE